MNIKNIEKTLKKRGILCINNGNSIIVGQYESIYRRIRLRRDKETKTFLYQTLLRNPSEKNTKVYLKKIIGINELVSDDTLNNVIKLAKLYSNFINENIYLSMDNFNNGVKILLNNDSSIQEHLDNIRDDLTKNELRNT